MKPRTPDTEAGKNTGRVPQPRLYERILTEKKLNLAITGKEKMQQMKPQRSRQRPRVFLTSTTLR